MGMVLDGVAASEAVDSAGEVMSIAGADISDLENGRATLNVEHRGDEAPGFSFNDHIGRITYAKKVLKESDCDDERQRGYWKMVNGLPFIYIKAELFDGEDHPGAKAAAAMIRHYQKRGLPLLVRYSIEGTTLSKKGNVLERTVARRVAATIKPCNKTCFSGVVKDDAEPNKEQTPDDPLAAILRDDAKKFERPDQQRLGGAVTIACNPEFISAAEQVVEALKVAKTMTAGSYNAAPGTLTGGACLQREDLASVHNVTARAKAALRDYDKHQHGDFKPYLKAQLPECSDEFIDRFAEVVNDYDLKAATLQKAAPAISDLFGGTAPAQPKPPKQNPLVAVNPGETEAPKPKAQVERERKQKKHKARVQDLKQEQATMLPGMQDQAPALAPEDVPTFHVQKRRTLGAGEAWFDDQQGILHTADGSFRVYIPGQHADVDHRDYAEVLKDPKLNRIHDAAIKNWMTLHRLAREGRMPHEIIAHAALFSAMSPNTPVPVQELAYGKLMDMQQRGFDPTQGFDPATGEMKGKYNAKQWARWAREWKSFVNGQMLPEWENAHFDAKDSGIWTAEGKRYKVGLGKQKWDGAKNYHEIHSTLVNLFDRFKHDGRSMSAELNRMKHEAGKTKEYDAATQEEPDVKGFAPKTIRYLLGMAGIGNVVVPDTHFIRHTFGLMEGDPKNEIIKKYLWNAKNEGLLGQLDRYYAANHPAVAHTRQKILDKYGEDLGEHATFPGFWLHWLSIQPHEERRGWRANKAKNANTDHAVFWNAVKRVLKKYRIPHDGRLLKNVEVDGASMAARCAHAYAELENQFGTTPAQFAFHSHLAPALMNHPEDPLAKSLLLATNLKKALLTEDQCREMGKAPERKVFRGKAVVPGEVQFTDGPLKGTAYPLLHSGHDWHYVEDELGNVKKLNPKHPSIRVTRMPEVIQTPFRVHAEHHALGGASSAPEQRELLHGLDLGGEGVGVGGTQHGYTHLKRPDSTGWYRSLAGHLGYVKPAAPMSEFKHSTDDFSFSPAEREAAFYRLAKDFFGLGEHVPAAAAFRHPVSGEPYSVSKHVPGSEHYDDSPAHLDMLSHMLHTGRLDKLALMDMVLNQNDRHNGNFMLTPGQAPHLHLIDNGLGFAPDDHSDYVTDTPNYWSQAAAYADGEDWHQQPLHVEALRWAAGLDPKKLDAEMDKLGIPLRQRHEAVRRLTALQERIQRQGRTTTRGAAFFAPFIHPAQPTVSDNTVLNHTDLN